MKSFKSYEEYEAWTEQFTDCYQYEDIPVLIDDGWKRAIDMMTECKSWKTALRRFEKTFGSVPEVSDWIPFLRESAECGCFSDRLSYYDKEYERKMVIESGSYSYGIEEVSEGTWYIYLNLSGAYAGYPVRA